MTTYLNPSTRHGGVEQIVVGERPLPAPVDDAPFDDEQYVRFNGEWVPYLPPAPDTTAPAPPTDLAASGTVIPAENAVDYLLSWTAPTTNEDTTPLMDFAYYVVRWRYVGASAWTSFVSNDDEFLLSRATLGLDIEWGVLARDYNGNDSSWAADTITGAVDTTGPNEPSVPSVSTSSGTITVAWDGEDHLGAAQPSDFSHLEIFISSTTGGPWTLVGSLTGVGSTIITGVPVGATRYITTVALDESGNTSPRSAEVSVTVAGFDGGELEPGSVDAVHLAPGAFVNPLMRTQEFVGDGTTATTTSTTGVAMGTAGAEGVFEAPASGIIDVTVMADLSNSAISSASACSFEVREGTTIGSGTVVDAASINKAALGKTIEAIRSNGTYLVDGLTPGADYNIRTIQFSDSGSNTASAALVRLLLRPSF